MQWFDSQSMQGFCNQVATFSGAGNPWLKGVARANIELTSLASRRAQAYVELPSRLQACRTPQDLIAEQTRFWTQAFAQYNESCGKVLAAYGELPSMAQQDLTREQASASNKRERDTISFRDSKDEEAEVQSTPSKGTRRAAA